MNRITLNTALQVATRIVELASGLLVNAWLARQWGSGAFGQIGFYMSLAAICTFLFDFGLGNLLIRTVAREPRLARHVVLNGGLTVVPLSLFGSAVLMGFGLWSTGGTGEGSQHVGVLALACLQLFFNAQALLLKASFYAYERMELESVPALIERVTWIGAGIWLALQPPSLVMLFGWLALCKGLNLLLSLGLFLLYVRPKTDPARWEPATGLRLMREAVPFGLNQGLCTIFLLVDVLFLAHWAGDEVTGHYRAVGMLILPLTMVAVSLINSLFPRMSAAARSGTRQVASYGEAASRILMRAAMPASLMMFLYAPEVIALLFGSEYLPAVPLLQLLSLAVPLRFLNNALGTVLTACDRQRDRMTSAAIAAGFNVVANLLVIPRWHAVGACLTTLLTDVVLGLSFWYFLRQTAPMREAGGQVALHSLTLASVVLIPLYLAGAPLILASLILALGYPALVLVLRSRLLSPLEVQLLWRHAP